MRRLDVILFGGTVQQARGDVCIVPLPEDERPLRGDAGVVDWRLNGKISELLQSRFCSGAFGEAAMLPAGAGVRAERVLLVGVGPRSALYGRGLVQAATLAGARLVSVRAGTAVFALPESLDLDRDARALLAGLARAITVPRGSARMRVVFPCGDGNARGIRQAWGDITADLASFDIEGALEEEMPRSLGFEAAVAP